MSQRESSTNYSTDWCILSNDDVVKIKNEFDEHIWIYFKSEHLATNHNQHLPEDVNTDDNYFLCQVALDDRMEVLLNNRVTGFTDEMEELLGNKVTDFTENDTQKENVIKREELYGEEDMYITPHLSFVCNKNNADGVTQLCHRWNKVGKVWEKWNNESDNDENIYSSLMIDLHRKTTITDGLKRAANKTNKSKTIEEKIDVSGKADTTIDGSIYGPNISKKIGTKSHRLAIEDSAGVQNDGLSLTDIAKQFIFDVETLDKWLSGDNGELNAENYIKLFLPDGKDMEKFTSEKIKKIKENAAASFKPPADHVIPFHNQEWKESHDLTDEEYKKKLKKSLFYGEHILGKIPERNGNEGNNNINNDVQDAIYKLCDMFEYTKCLMNDALEDDTQSNDGLFSINRDNVFKMTNALNEESYDNFMKMLGEVKISGKSGEKYASVTMLDVVRTWSYVSIESLTTSNMFTETLVEKINEKLKGLTTGDIVGNTYKINILMMPSVLKYIHDQVNLHLDDVTLSETDKFTYMRYLSFIREMLYSILESIENIRMASKQYSLQINVVENNGKYSIVEKTTENEGVVSMREDIKTNLTNALDKQNQGNISVFLRLNDRYYDKGNGNYEVANKSYNLYNPRFYIGMDKQPNPKEMTFGYDHTMGVYKPNGQSEFTMIDNEKSKWINNGFVTVEKGKYNFNPTGKDSNTFNEKLERVFKKNTEIDNPETKHTKFYKFGKYNEIFTPNLDNKTIAKQESIKTGIIDVLNAGKNVFVMGYGSSGAGKTSSLVYLDNGTKGEEGIMVEICNKIKCDTLTVSIMEQGQKATIDDINRSIKEKGKYAVNGERSSDKMSSVLEKCVDVEFTKRKGDGTWVLSDAWCDRRGLSLAYIKELKFESRNGVASDSLNKIKGGETTLGKFLEILIDKDRHVMATTNNPQSSRSHVLAFIKFKGIDGVNSKSDKVPECHSEEDATATLIVGDFAGVENEFNHKDVQNTLVKYANVKKNNTDSLFYDVDGLTKDLGVHAFTPRDNGNKNTRDELTLEYFHGKKYITNQANKALTIPTANNEDEDEVRDFVKNYLSDDDIDAGNFVPIIKDMWSTMWGKFENRKDSENYFNTFLQKEIKLPGSVLETKNKFIATGTMSDSINSQIEFDGHSKNIEFNNNVLTDIRDKIINDLTSKCSYEEKKITSKNRINDSKTKGTVKGTVEFRIVWIEANQRGTNLSLYLYNKKSDGIVLNDVGTKPISINRTESNEYHKTGESKTGKSHYINSDDIELPSFIRQYVGDKRAENLLIYTPPYRDTHFGNGKTVREIKDLMSKTDGHDEIRKTLIGNDDFSKWEMQFFLTGQNNKLMNNYFSFTRTFELPLYEDNTASTHVLTFPQAHNQQHSDITKKILRAAVQLNSEWIDYKSDGNFTLGKYKITGLHINRFTIGTGGDKTLTSKDTSSLSEKEKGTLKEMINYLRYRMLIADAVAKKRTTEGKYINTALSDLRQDIKNSLFLKNHDTFLNFPSVASTCREYHCLNPKAEVGGVHRMNCSGVSECSLYVDSILDDDNKSTINDNGNRLLTMKSDGTFIKGSNCIEEQFKKTNLVIFGVLNIAVGSNDPPPLEYVDINPIKRANLDNKQFLNLFFGGLDNLPAVIKDKFKEKYGATPAAHGLYDDLDQTEFIEFIDQYNAPAAISTLEFFDNMISFLRTNSSCELKPNFDAKTKDYLSTTCGYVNAKLKTGKMNTDSIVEKFMTMGGKLSINMKTKKQRRTRRKKQQRTRKLQMFTN